MGDPDEDSSGKQPVGTAILQAAPIELSVKKKPDYGNYILQPPTPAVVRETTLLGPDFRQSAGGRAGNDGTDRGKDPPSSDLRDLTGLAQAFSLESKFLPSEPEVTLVVVRNHDCFDSPRGRQRSIPSAAAAVLSLSPTMSVAQTPPAKQMEVQDQSRASLKKEFLSSVSSNEISAPTVSRNKWWKGHVEDLFESFLDAESILMLRQTCSALYHHECKLGKQNFPRFLQQLKISETSNAPRLLVFTSLGGYDGQLICDKLLKLTLVSLCASVRRTDGIVLDLSQCVNVRDAQLAFLASPEHHGFVPAPPQPKSAKPHNTRLVGLRLDYCMNITDKGISALLAAHLPYLTSLSLNGIRSENFTGYSLKEGLDPTFWPKLLHVFLNFTSVSLEALMNIAEFLTRSPGDKRADAAEPLEDEANPSVDCGDRKAKRIVQLEFAGSAASKVYLESIGAKGLIKALAVALNSGQPEQVEEVCQRADREMDELLEARIASENDILAPFLVGLGSKYLVNTPVTCPTSEEGGVNVWTLPISVAVTNGNLGMVRMLRSFGAELDVIDHLGKSPLFRAVSIEHYEIARYLIRQKVQLIPHNLTSASCLNMAIEARCMKLARLLLESGYPLPLKCPGIKSFKSPLQVACEIGDEELIHALLDWGANPNSYSGSHKNSPVMLAYKTDPRFLPVFLQGGAGGRLQSYPLMSEILSVAIAKNDVKSVELLLSLFPDLVTRAHTTWSYPHIQAAKTGRGEILDAILSSFLSAWSQCFSSLSKSVAMGSSDFFLDIQTVREGKAPSPDSKDALGSGLHVLSRASCCNDETLNFRSQGFGVDSSVDNTDLRGMTTSGDNKPNPKSLYDSGSKEQRRWTANERRSKAGEQITSVDVENSGHGLGGMNLNLHDLLSSKDSQMGNTALHYAAEEGRVDCAIILLRFGASVDMLNEHNQTALHLACQENRVDIAQLLLYSGGSLEIRDNESRETPLMTAIRARNDQLALIIFKYQIHRETVHKRAGCEPEAASTELHQGQTALAYALYFGRYNIARELMKKKSEVENLFRDQDAANATYAAVCEKLSGSETCRVENRRVLDRFIALYKQRQSGPSDTEGHQSPAEEGVVARSASSSGATTSLSDDEVKGSQGGSSNPPVLAVAPEQVPCMLCDHNDPTEWNSFVLQYIVQEAAGQSPDELNKEGDKLPSSAVGSSMPLSAVGLSQTTNVPNDEDQTKTRPLLPPNAEGAAASGSNGKPILNRAKRLQGRLKSVARKPFLIFHRQSRTD